MNNKIKFTDAAIFVPLENLENGVFNKEKKFIELEKSRDELFNFIVGKFGITTKNQPVNEKNDLGLQIGN